MSIFTHLDMVGSYDNSSIDLEGTTESLRELSSEIKCLAQSKTFTLAIPSTTPAPYLAFLKLLTIRVNTEPVCISRHNDEITISGSVDKLQIFASCFDHLAKDNNSPFSEQIREHLHVDYFPNHYYLKHGSIPLIIAKRIGVGPEKGVGKMDIADIAENGKDSSPAD